MDTLVNRIAVRKAWEGAPPPPAELLPRPCASGFSRPGTSLFALSPPPMAPRVNRYPGSFTSLMLRSALNAEKENAEPVRRRLEV